MKPDAPEEYRGQFWPISTNVPGIDVCELLPLHAKCADKYTLIRSIAHKFNDHGGGSKRVMTGRIPDTPTGTVNDAPSVDLDRLQDARATLRSVCRTPSVCPTAAARRWTRTPRGRRIWA